MRSCSRHRHQAQVTRSHRHRHRHQEVVPYHPCRHDHQEVAQYHHRRRHHRIGRSGIVGMMQDGLRGEAVVVFTPEVLRSSQRQGRSTE